MAVRSRPAVTDQPCIHFYRLGDRAGGDATGGCGLKDTLKRVAGRDRPDGPV